MPNLNFDPQKDIPDLTGKTIFITGGTNGIGAAAATHFANHNAAHIYISGRNAKSAEKVIDEVRASGSKTTVSFVQCDLASLASVKRAAEQFVSQTTQLDILICNAGVMALPPGLTADGYEIQFGTNHLGHALLIKKLLPLLETRANGGDDARIIILTSDGARLHPKGGIIFEDLKTVQDFCVGGPWLRYAQSKLANLMYARELSRRYPGITSVSVHPGVVATSLVGSLGVMDKAIVYGANLGNLLKPEEGAYNQVWAATTTQKLQNGAWYEPVGKLAESKLDKTSKDNALAERLWEWTEEHLAAY
ncbi:uncharacterized protein N7459_001231 [Penicillium hispanicum]|uniref:uncharacterized protein n=1 Tax=Penicillium hispanicum TaxID=1080232 RepID=UPI00253FFF92|nr:uncharacterized protein N7459_001231 [Penicillium hispanicum]KAJ5595023.1 hypothetical protein N7459_001231 [Penicillium hispanicum]